jgi:ectoine hydroxylase-related dioxygenase (phytanoyl-CoA dioxygenase family)
MATTGKIGNMAAFLLRAIAEEDEEEEVDGGDEEVKTKTLVNSTQKRICVDGDAYRKDRDGVYVFNDQYIVKPPHMSGVEFPWHRDGQYEMWKTPDQSVPLPYLSAWVALDDVSEENGALRFKKNEQESFGPDIDVASIRDEDDDDIATMNAGSVVFFMSDVLHASGKNMSEETRRAWMPQYSLGLPKEEDDKSRNSDSFRCLRTALSGV